MSRKLKIIILIMAVICIILLGTSIYLLTKKKNQTNNGENNEILNNAITENAVEENIENQEERKIELQGKKDDQKDGTLREMIKRSGWKAYEMETDDLLMRLPKRVREIRQERK